MCEYDFWFCGVLVGGICSDFLSSHSFVVIFYSSSCVLGLLLGGSTLQCVACRSCLRMENFEGILFRSFRCLLVCSVVMTWFLLGYD